MNEMVERRWFLDQLKRIDPAISRTSVQDWITDKRIAPGLLVQGKRIARYEFTADELGYVMILAWLSRFGVLRGGDLDRITVWLDSSPRVPDEVDSARVGLHDPGRVLDFCRSVKYDVGIIVRARVAESEGDYPLGPDPRVKRGDVIYSLIYRTRRALHDQMTRWWYDETPGHRVHFPGQHEQVITLFNVRLIMAHVADVLGLEMPPPLEMPQGLEIWDE